MEDVCKHCKNWIVNHKHAPYGFCNMLYDTTFELEWCSAFTKKEALVEKLKEKSPAQNLRDFIIAVLDDDHGISEKAFNFLKEFQGQGNWHGIDIDDIMSEVKATDGRFYIDMF